MRLGWTTDPHLNFVDEAGIIAFGKKIEETGVDALVITGDIAEATTLSYVLRVLRTSFTKRIYFVIGNHDFYGAAISTMEAAMKFFKDPDLVYLTNQEVIQLTHGCALVGENGWYDGRNGDMLGSDVMLADMMAISEIATLFKSVQPPFRRQALQPLLAALGDRAVARVRPKLEKALEAYDKVIFATHFPPFPQAAWHQGKPSDKHWLPYFSSKVMGDMLFELMEKNPTKKMLVLCGHSHGGGVFDPLPNLHVITGKAKYRHPKLNKVISIEETLTIA